MVINRSCLMDMSAFADRERNKLQITNTITAQTSTIADLAKRARAPINNVPQHIYNERKDPARGYRTPRLAQRRYGGSGAPPDSGAREEHSGSGSQSYLHYPPAETTRRGRHSM